MRIDLDFSVGAICTATVLSVFFFCVTQCSQIEAAKASDNIRACIESGHSWVSRDEATRRTGCLANMTRE